MRDFEKPLCRIGANGSGLTRAVGNVLWTLSYEGAQQVFIESDLRVYAFPVGTMVGERACCERSQAFVGTYELRGGRAIDVRRTLRADVITRFDEITSGPPQRCEAMNRAVLAS